jgi:dGTPase
VNTTPREKAEAREKIILGPYAAHSSSHMGRNLKESPCPARTAYQVDCHRIVHSKAFRRLKGKTQVFLWPKGDHYRTRITHCLEVSQIGRTLARALSLNEDLVEAIALGHDLGHTPFGHAGEEVLQKLVPSGFRHEQQSLRVVERLENNGQGLNLTSEVRDGILRHSKGAGPLNSPLAEQLPCTLEGQVVRFSDVIAYVNHDLDDAMRAGVIDSDQLPPGILKILGTTHSDRLTHFVVDIVRETNLEDDLSIAMGEKTAAALEELRFFLNKEVYYNSLVHAEFEKARRLLERLWEFFTDNLDRFYDEFWPSALRDGIPEMDIRDFLAGMTDAFAVNLFDQVFSPKRWYIL